VVANANAVIDPYAVMIEPTNADVAHSAVFGSRRLNGLTSAQKLPGSLNEHMSRFED